MTPHMFPKLVSIGCVTADGREFYAELSDTYEIGECSDFVTHTVLPLLEGGAARMFETQLASRLQEWVVSLGGDVIVFRSDSPGLDWPFVAYLFSRYNCWPANLRRKCESFYFDSPTLQQQYVEAVESYWTDNMARQHHALVVLSP